MLYLDHEISNLSVVQLHAFLTLSVDDGENSLFPFR